MVEKHVKILLNEYIELKDSRSTKTLNFWRGWHIIIYILIVIFGIFHYSFFQSTRNLVDDKCLLYPKDLEFIFIPLEEFKHNYNDVTTESIDFTTSVVPETDLAVKELKYRLSNSSTLRLLEGNGTHLIILDTTRTLFRSDNYCEFVEYMPLLSSIFAFIWIIYFIMCPAGSHSRLPKPWRILIPALTFAIVLVAVTAHSFTTTDWGLNAFCAGFHSITNSTSCKSVSPYLERSYSSNWDFGFLVSATKAASAGVWTGWVCAAALLLARCIVAPDFKAQRAKVYVSHRIHHISSTSDDKKKIKDEIIKYLDEMGMEKKMYVIRWMGIFFLKVCFMMDVGVFVNEPAVLHLRSTMGSNPVLFLPTHRSYADFCLMTYLCYHYDIDLPAVAAGMDFYSMALVGRSMRDTCAFYIRRTLVGAPIYAATLKAYVRTIVAKHSAPIEFFLEGTRSRSNKSMAPKYGMLSMSLMPVFSGEVSDITIVPININYERLMEQSLFAYEHLGVPKPKETTRGLLKALSRLNANFGNIYINLGAPISVKEYTKNQPITDEHSKPVQLQELTKSQFTSVQDLANIVVLKQQQLCMLSTTNVVAMVLMESLIRGKALNKELVLQEAQWHYDQLKKLGALVDDGWLDLDRILSVHENMFRIDKDGCLKLVSDIMPYQGNISNMKGHTLKAETISHAVPIIQLQLYVNTCLSHLVPPAFISLIVNKEISKDELRIQYVYLRKLFKSEFFYIDSYDDEVFSNSLNYCEENGIVSVQNGNYKIGDNEKLLFLLKWAVWPFFTTLTKCIDVFREINSCEHKQSLKCIQERIEMSNCHPYCLSLESIANCIQGLVSVGALIRNKINESIIYEVFSEEMNNCNGLVQSVIPVLDVDFINSNSVIYGTIVPSRL